MNAKLSTTVFNWLRYSGIKVSRTYLDHQLQSHPDYPSLASITDTLDELGIENMSLIVDKEKLNELPVPFLAHSHIDGGGFIVINNTEQQIKQDKEFEKHWDGIVVFVEKPAGWHHAENENALTKEKATRQQAVFGIAAIVLLAAFSLFNHFSISLAGLLLASIVGLGVVILIVQQELGISNEITEQLCNAGGQSDCNGVIKSKGSKLSKWFSWPDAGIIYFASFLLLLITSPQSAILPLISAAAIPFIFFSVYYQLRIVKKWCTLCLLTVTVLFIQFALLLPVILNLLKGEVESFPFDIFLFPTFVFAAIGVVWLLVIKPALQKNKELIQKNYSLQRFKNTPDIFNALLKQQRKVDIIPFDSDLQLGNHSSSVQIMMACSPYCVPCAKAHKVLHKLVEENDIGLTVRFSVNPNNREDENTRAVEYLFRLLLGKTKGYKSEVVHAWYETMDMEKFKKHHPIDRIGKVDGLLKLQEQWVKKSEIQFTPTIFINGCELPRQYRIDELKYSIRRIKKEFKTVKPFVELSNNSYV